MKKVGRIADFPKDCCVAIFYAKTYEEAVVLAGKSPLPLLSYYEQPHFGGTKFSTILASYMDGKNEQSNSG